MKLLRVILALIFVVLTVLLLLLMCQPKDAIICVIDATTKAPIEEATVEIETTDKYCPEATLTTDEEGQCTFRFRDSQKELTQAIASMEGYEPASVEDLELSFFEDEVLVIPLKPLRQACIQVIDKDSRQPIADAAVRIVGSPYPGSIVLTTDNQGMCCFPYSDSQQNIDTLMAVKNGYSGKLFAPSVPINSFSNTFIVELEKFKTCNTDINNDDGRRDRYNVEAFYMGDYDDYSRLHFKFEWHTYAYPDRIIIRSGTYDQLVNGTATIVFDNQTFSNMITEHVESRYVDLCGPMIFVEVTNYYNSSSSSTSWKYKPYCPEPKN